MFSYTVLPNCFAYLPDDLEPKPLQNAIRKNYVCSVILTIVNRANNIGLEMLVILSLTI